MTQVAVLGLWHLGLVSAACLSELGHPVIGYDPNETLVHDLNNGRPPLYEPGLKELIKARQISGGLCFTVDLKKAVSNAETVLITFDTPVDEQDQVDLSTVEQILQACIPLLKSGAIVIVNSQVPVGSSEGWQRLIDAARPAEQIDLVYSPENLRLGQAIELFKRPDMVVVGHHSERARVKAGEFYRPFPAEKFFVSWRTAEMAKHALNAFFATSISFANEIGHLCDAVGADGMEIAKILKKDSRIGAKAQVRPGLGFAGATLARDLRALQKLGKECEEATPLIDSVFTINKKQIERIVWMLDLWFENRLDQKTFTVFGLTYKPGTSTLRRSASLEIIRLLHQKGARVKAHDPKANLEECRGEKFFEFVSDPYEACKESQGILLLTEWPEYRGLDYSKIGSLMSKPKLVFDTKSFLDGEKLRQLGFSVLEIGRGQLAEVRS